MIGLLFGSLLLLLILFRDDDPSPSGGTYGKQDQPSERDEYDFAFGGGVRHDGCVLDKTGGSIEGDSVDAIEMRAGGNCKERLGQLE